MVPGIDVAPEVDQPDVVVLVSHREANALIGKDNLCGGGLVAMEV